jgi:hypothetical protein
LNERREDQRTIERLRRENLERANAGTTETKVEAVAWAIVADGYMVDYSDTTKQRCENVAREYGEGANIAIEPLYPASAITALEGEVAMLRDALHIETHKVITCGVAASHPDASLSRRMEYSGKWDSPQAQQVRALRDKADAAERRVAELENLLTAIRPYAQHADECGDMDAYNNASIESCGCGLDSLLDAVSEALTKETP